MPVNKENAQQKLVEYDFKISIFTPLEQENKNTVRITDLKAYEELFRTHYGNLCSYANKYLEELEAAEEIVQDVFVKLWENRETLEITTNVQSYLFRAVRNSCLNLIKHINIREEYKVYNEQELKNRQHFLDDEIHASELEEKIREAIELLPVERRRVFVMSRYDGLKYKEIAEKLDISGKTVENQMGKAIKFLKEKLSGYITVTVIYLIKLINGNGWG